MASTSTDIANGALGRLGQPAITTITDATNRDAVQCNLYYQPNRDVCLAMVDWVVLTQKVALVRAAKATITNITKATPPVVTTSATHTYVVNDLVTIEDVIGMTQVNYGMFTVNAITSTTLTLFDVEGAAVAGAGYSSYSSGGSVYRHPGNDWAYVYDLPTDSIRPLAIMDENFGESPLYTWKKERTWVYCNVKFAAVKYLKKNTDVTVWDDDMVELMEARLAWLVAPRVTQDVSIKQQLYQEWQMAYGRARINNSRSQLVQQGSVLWTSVGKG